MALKDTWKDLIDGESEIDVDDINNIAHSIIEIEKNGLGEEIIVDSEMSDISENPVQNKVVKSYVDCSIDDSKQFIVVCEGEIDESTSGVLAIKAEITEDISAMREFKFYVEFPVTEENAGTSAYINANINGSVAGNNCFCAVSSVRASVAGNTYHTMCISNVVEGADEKHILSMQTQIMEKKNNGTSSRISALSAKAPWVFLQNTNLYLNINNTVAFLSGTKWRLEGR